MKIYSTIASLTFFYIIKILFLYKIQVLYLSSLFFHKILTQSSIKDKKMKYKRGNINVYIKIMYRESLLVPYTLENTVTTIDGWLNIENLM
jgi:hypothetical protein